MDELGWRVGLLGAGLLAALAWLISALRRAPKRGRWQRFRALQREERDACDEGPRAES